MPDDLSGPNRFARDLFAPLPARYDRLAELLSFGQNGQWRSAMVGHVAPVAPDGPVAPVAPAVPAVPAGGVILDVASGTAGVALQLAARSQARVVGVDLTEQMLGQGRRRVAAAGMSDRVVLVAGRAEQLPFPDAYFDALTFTYLLRYVRDPQATLTELARVLKPGGTMASLEFAVPSGAVWGPAWWAYTRLLLPAGGLLLGGREWYRVGRFLGPNISAHYRRYPVSWTVQAWQKAGFTEVGTRIMSLGGGLVMWGKRA
jgi:demethylmenaquinone methyltransferase / 2-methoxy-6-polyprenyl-1,4-benzoquinol methylase